MVHDQFADPKLNRLVPDPGAEFDIALGKDSPAINAGVMIPDDWFDPIKVEDEAPPDIGALPHSRPSWSVGIRGRIRVGSTVSD